MKKLISIGVVLALLTIAVVPAAVAADDLCVSNYTEPCTYAKVPFAIIASGIQLVGDIVNKVPMISDALPFDLGAITGPIASWTYGPLSWTVDMLAWGVNLVAKIYPSLDDALDIGMPWVGDVLQEVACGLRECFTDVCYNVSWNCTVDGSPCCP